MRAPSHFRRVYTGIMVWSLCLFLTFAGKAAEGRYVVKRNDTLTEIARKYGVSITALMRHNRLNSANKILAGDVLRIPSVSTRSKTGSAEFESGFQAQLDTIRVLPRKWKYVVIHHSATDGGNAQGMDRYHREERNMENGLAYHFLIGNGNGMRDGEIAIGRRWLEQLNGGHLKSEALNEQSIGICLVGNFDSKRPTPEQMASLERLVEYLMRRCGLEKTALKTHQQMHPIHTRCPGRYFPARKFVQQLAATKS